MRTYRAQPGVHLGRPPCQCGAAERLHDPILRRCPTPYRPATIPEAERELATAEASGDQARIFVARGNLQRLQGRRT